MKIGLIGCGGTGEVHSAVLAELAKEMDVTVCAIADKVEGSLREVAEQWPRAALYTDGDGVRDQRYGRLESLAMRRLSPKPRLGLEQLV